MTRVEYFDINANNVNSVTSIYVNDQNKEKLTKVLASSFTKKLTELEKLYLINTKITDINILLKNKILKTVYCKQFTNISNKLENLPKNKHFEIFYI